MNNSVLVDRQTFILQCTFCSLGGGAYNKIKIPVAVQELGGQRGEGAYFREDTVYVETRYSVLYGVFKVFVMSKALVSFADCHCFPHFLISSRWTEKTAVGSFQQN